MGDYSSRSSRALAMIAFTIQVAGAEWRLNWPQVPVTNVTKSFQKPTPRPLVAPARCSSGKNVLNIFLFFIDMWVRSIPTPYRKPEAHTYQQVHFRGKFSKLFKNPHLNSSFSRNYSAGHTKSTKKLHWFIFIQKS